jgi:hypothetical protein
VLDHPSTAVSPFLRIISAMITPAILILATGSLVTSTMARLNRAGDRARALIIQLPEADGDPQRIELYRGWLFRYRRRSGLTERALTSFYVAIFMFVGGSLAIAADDVLHASVPWLSLALVVTGALVLFFGTAALVIETQLATGQLRSEIEFAMGETIEQMEAEMRTPPKTG